MTRESPVVSVVVATYNQSRYLPGLLASLQAQDCDVSREIIVCDDGSSDETFACVQAYGRTSACDIRYVWQPDLGFRLGRSRNNGMRCARGDVLVFIHANSLLRPYFLRDHLEAHQGADNLVYGGRQFITLPDGVAAECHADVLAKAEGPIDVEGQRWWLQTGRPWMACIGANLSVKKSRCLPFDEVFEGWGSEDRDFAYRFWAAGGKIEVLRRTGLAQLLRNEAEHWNPLSGGHKAIVAALKGKLHLARKYPGDLMAPSLDLVRCCYIEETTNTWQLGAPRTHVPVSALLDEFATWLEAEGETDGGV